MKKRVYATIMPYQEMHGPYTIQTSEQAYRQYQTLIDGVLPVHGGILQPESGTWTRHNSITGDFASYLIDTVRERDQGYWPACVPYGMGGEGAFLVLLEQPRRWPGIAGGLVKMALLDFDAPWSGVLYDYPGGGGKWTGEQVRAQERFVTVLSQAVRTAGLPFAVAFRGIVPADESRSPSLDVFRDITDRLDYYMYVYWASPYSPSPFWWHRASIENALRHGVRARNIYLGLFVASWYYDTGQGFHHWITHDQAMQIVRENGARVEWVEDHAAGLIREKCAAIGDAGHLWIEDGDTIKPRLALVDEYGLGGVMLFVLGCEDESVWDVIAEWKRGVPHRQPGRPIKRPKTGNHHCGLSASGGLLSNTEV
jgi:hypothetical protein